MTNLPGLETIIEITYLVATALFILALKWLSSPTTARRGVFAGELGMLLAIAGTLLHHGIVEYNGSSSRSSSERSSVSPSAKLP